MLLLYDPESDVIQVELDAIPDGSVDHTEDVSRGPTYSRGIDRGKNGEILGYNFMRASKGIDLEGLPHTEALVKLFDRLGAIEPIAASSPDERARPLRRGEGELTVRPA